METLILQIRAAMQSKLYYVALLSALSIPDIAGALGAEDGRASKRRYVSWYEKWVRPRHKESVGKDNPFSGEACYAYRCSMIHQGASHATSSAYEKIMFIEPGYQNHSISYCVIGQIDRQALLIQVVGFIEEICSGCELWLAAVEDDQHFKNNYSNFARRHSEGLAPWVSGAPIIG